MKFTVKATVDPDPDGRHCGPCPISNAGCTSFCVLYGHRDFDDQGMVRPVACLEDEKACKLLVDFEASLPKVRPAVCLEMYP
jgi:hypothetical protein